MSKSGLLVRIGSNLGIMPSLTKIRYSFIKSSHNSGNVFQGFVVKFFQKTYREGCNLVTVYHEGDPYGNYNVSSVVNNVPMFLGVIILR